VVVPSPEVPATVHYGDGQVRHLNLTVWYALYTERLPQPNRPGHPGPRHAARRRTGARRSPRASPSAPHPAGHPGARGSSPDALPHLALRAHPL